MPDATITVAAVGGAFTLGGILVAEYIKRSQAIKVVQTDDRKDLTNTLIAELKEERTLRQGLEVVKRSIERKYDTLRNYMEQILLETDNLMFVTEELTTLLEEAGYKDLAMREHRVASRIKSLVTKASGAEEEIVISATTDSVNKASSSEKPDN